MSEQNQTPTEENTAPEVVKTPREKLVDKYNALVERRKDIDLKLADIVAEVRGIDDAALLVEGAAVFVTLGKGETLREVAGSIIGKRVEEDGTSTFKVAYGAGFDADVAVVKAGKLRLSKSEPVAEA